MRDFMRRIFLDDAVLKLVSLVLAVILFLVRSDWEASTTAYVRVQYSHPQDRVVTSDLPAEVKVVIRGPWSRTNRFSEAELDPIYIDLAHREPGELRLTEDMLKLPPGLHVASFTPPSIYFEFEPKVEHTLTVQPLIEGEPADGYRLAKVTVAPRTVRAVGAKDALEALRNAVTRPVHVTGLRSPVVLQIKLAQPPKFVHYPDAPEITVHLDVERTLVERTYTDVPIAIAGSTHLADQALQPDRATVVLRGPELALEKLKGTPELVVDAAPEEHKPPGEYRKRVQVVNLPPDVAAEVRPEGVHLVVSKPAAVKR